MSAFEELGVMPELIRAVEEMDWMLPTPIQQEAVPLILGGGDVLAAAETGSGKTGAFALPVLQIAHEVLREQSTSKVASGTVGEAIKMNSDDRDPIFAISPDGLLCQARAERNWAGGRASVGFTSGKYYYEATVTDEGLCRVGWSTTAASLDVGTDRQSFGYGGTGKKSHNRQFEDYGEPFGRGDTIGCFIDLDEKEIYFSKNGKDLGLAFEIPKHLHTAAFYPSLVMKNAEMRMNFGNQSFRSTPARGHVGCAQAEVAKTTLGVATTTSGRKPVILILEPTRELSEQIFHEITKFKTYLTSPTIEHVLCVGGEHMGTILATLRSGIDIVVGTPGCVGSLVDSGKIDVTNIRFMVLDEADRFTEPENRAIILNIFQKIPKGSKRLQVLCFSATLHSPEIRDLAETITKYPTWVDLKGKDAVPETVHHAVVRVDSRKDRSWGASRVPVDGVHDRDRWGPEFATRESLSQGIKKLKPQILMKIIEQYKMDQCLIFCRTKVDCDNLEAYFISVGGGRKFTGKAEKGKENPFSCVVLHADRSPPERRSNLQAFKDGDVRFLICTDVAARGIDIKELPYVINMTLPDKSEDYIHRVGRVGRADAMGLAISLVATDEEKVWYHTCASRGKSCSNTNLVDNGGCTIWYDEPALLKEVETRLGGTPLTELNEKYELPASAAGVIYGQAKGTAEAVALAAANVAKLKPTVEALGNLEVRAQRSFLMLREKYQKSRT